MNEFLERLKQRKLVQWTLAYVAAAFALLQGIDIVAQRFGWPDAIERALIIASCIGFFVVLVLAWYHGERGAQHVTGTELLILAILLAIGGGLLWRFASVLREPVASPAATSAALIPEKSIAVLPFENLSDDKANAYFASGMQDMILTKLAGIGDLKVISRTSTEKYKSHPDDLKVVGQQLGVATILEGSVQKSGNQVLINLQLIDATSDNHLWADAYPRTLDNVFGVEGEVAQKVADALKARLTPVEAARVGRAPTRNASAYDLFLRAEYEAQQANDSWQEPVSLAADADYQQAIALDPDFALAQAELAYNQLNRHWTVKHLTTEELAAVKALIDRALALAPTLPEAHLALAYYEYWGFRHYDEAVAEFQRTLELAPSNALALQGIAFISRRTGRWHEAITYFEKALPVSPRDGNLRGEYGNTLLILRRHQEADSQLRLALEYSPDDVTGKDSFIINRLFGFGDAQGAQNTFRAPPPWRLATANPSTGDVMYLINLRVYPNVFARRFAEALRAWDSAPGDTPQQRLTGRVARAAIQIIAGQKEAARIECERIAPEMESALKRQPDSLDRLQEKSWVALGLGQNAEAIQAAERAVKLMPLEKDSWLGERELAALAEIAAHANAPEESLRLIHQLLSIPAGDTMTIERLKLDPVWDPLRPDSRFQDILKSSATEPKDVAP